MDQVLNRSLIACPNLNATDLIMDLYNFTRFTKDQLALFACEYSKIDYGTPKFAYWNGLTYLIGFVFGLPSALMAILIFSRKEFLTVSFFYHRVINVIELFYMAFVLENALEWTTGDLKSKSWAWSKFLTYFHYKLDLALPLAIQLITVWIAIERVAVCFRPHLFQMINRKSIANTVVIGALIASLVIYAPLAFTSKFVYDNSTEKYIRTRTRFGETGQFETYIQFLAFSAILQFAFMTAATIGTVAGLVQSSRRKRRLAKSAGYKSVNARELIQQININTQLCFLQLCEAIPILVNCLVLVCIQTTSYPTDPHELVNLPYEVAMSHLRMFNASLYIGVVQTVVDLIEHSTHFYRYYIFSKKVRDTANRVIKHNTITPVITIIVS